MFNSCDLKRLYKDQRRTVTVSSEPTSKNENRLKEVNRDLDQLNDINFNAFLGPALWDETLSLDELNADFGNFEDISKLLPPTDEDSRDGSNSVASNETLPQVCETVAQLDEELLNLQSSAKSSPSFMDVAHPVARKTRKRKTPEELKDEEYWNRRRKNNAAAKRSRDARRLKENQINLRAVYLEKANDKLRTEVARLATENSALKKRLAKYEDHTGLF